VDHNTYSVPSRLVGEKVDVKLYAERVEVWYGQKKVESLPRLRGRFNHRVNYRHIIHWLVRKPGAFEHYRYRDELFPTTYFRAAYDWLRVRRPAGANREYLRILELAALESEERVGQALRCLLGNGDGIFLERVEAMVKSHEALPCPTSVAIDAVDLGAYDALLNAPEGEE
jgi:hypothetical protein